MTKFELDTFEFEGVEYDVRWESKDTRHGGPFDRGMADSYYGRRLNPHFYIGATGMSDLVYTSQMTEDEKRAYFAGYRYNEDVVQDFKEW